MSKVDPYLRFPSGRTIKDVKCDAKRFARTADISHTSALDTLARVNGLDMCWSSAMRTLSREHRVNQCRNVAVDAPPRIHYVGLDYRHRPDRVHPESADSEQFRIGPQHRMRFRRVRHALQLYREGHLSKTAIAEVCGIPITELQVHICRMNFIERTQLPHRHKRLSPAVRLRESPYRREREPE